MMDDFGRAQGLKSARLRYFNAAGADASVPAHERRAHSGGQSRSRRRIIINPVSDRGFNPLRLKVPKFDRDFSKRSIYLEAVAVGRKFEKLRRGGRLAAGNPSPH
jgi:hypothetical protein